MKTALDNLFKIISSEKISSAAKTTIRGFTQTRKISLLDVILFYTFRHCETTNKDISALYSKMEKPRCSKQAMFKAINKLNPDTIPLIIREFALDYYASQEYKTLDGYIVLACDGTKLDLPKTQEMRERFGGTLNMHVKDTAQIKKPQGTCSVLVDVLNHIVLDAQVDSYNTSEIPLLYKHLENCRDVLKSKKVILLCDRYYGSAEIFLYCRPHGYHYLIRSKSYMYKDKVAEVKEDGDISIEITRAWQRRLKRDDCREHASDQPILDMRIVKNHYEYFQTDKRLQKEPITVDSTYITDLPRDTHPKDTIVGLYHTQRWDIETAYMGIKNHLEAERFNSGKYNIVMNEIYGKILCYSICGLIYTCADDQMISKRSEEGRKTQYDYLPNMKYICDTIRLDQRFLQCFINQKSNEEKESYFSELLHDCAKNIVPVRAGRHYRRWGKWMSQIPTAKFRIDGRRDPPIRKCFKVNGYITTQHG